MAYCNVCGKQIPDGHLYCKDCASASLHQPGQPPQSAQPAPKKRASSRAVGCAVLLVLVICVGLYGLSKLGTQLPTTSGSTSQETQPTNTPRPANARVPPTAIPDQNTIRPGTYVVGTEIRPGIYRGQAGYDFFESCYWARLKDLAGTPDAIIANDNSIGRFYLEISKNDYAFQTRCALTFLSSLPKPVDQFPQSIKPGTYLVGIDIRAGTYKGEAGAELANACYWARLSGVLGGSESVIANDNAIGPFYVQVQPGDFALLTECELKRVGD